MATSKLPNRNGDVGRGSSARNSGDLGNAHSDGDNQWLLYGMLFFAIVAFLTLPISVLILMDAKKTNANSHAALAETKKLQAELKPVKKGEDDE